MPCFVIPWYMRLQRIVQHIRKAVPPTMASRYDSQRTTFAIHGIQVKRHFDERARLFSLAAQLCKTNQMKCNVSSIDFRKATRES